MNIPINDDAINKENQANQLKPRLSQPYPRTFGTDLSKANTVLQISLPDPQLLDYYKSDILTHLLETEHLYVPRAGYMSVHIEINEKMRAILIDWLIDVHYKFKLADETLYLTVNIIDRYLESTPITRNRLQLVGVSAMLIASKYEDIYPPEVQDFVNISDKAFTREDVLKMERSILKQLKYSVTVPSCFRFLQMFCKICETSEQHMAFARYFVELALVDYKMLKYSNSMKAAAALYLMHKFKEIKPEWNGEVSKRSKYKEEDLKTCAKDLCCLFQQASRSNLQAVKNKFSSLSLFQVATTPYI
jgi:cyclin B